MSLCLDGFSRYHLILFIAMFGPGCSSDPGDTDRASGDMLTGLGVESLVPDTIRVVAVRYFPTVGDRIDLEATGDWNESLDFTRHKVDSVSAALVRSLSEGTRYHAYKNTESTPSLIYEIVQDFELLEPLPTLSPVGDEVPMTDYAAIIDRLGGREWVEKSDVQEFWIWAYHGGVVGLWESNMAGPHADISNSDRNRNDLPVYSRTYTVYHYNYQRGTAEAMENHMHQFEAVLNYFDGRDDAAPEDWTNLLFWGHFVGSDTTHRLLEPIRAGWSHYPPNATKDYEWSNTSPVSSDIQDWTPDGSGRWRDVTCELWECDHLKWFIFWNQNIPGAANGLFHDGRPLRNWWTFLSRVDTAFDESWRLWR